MTELLTELVDKWTLLIAVLAVGCTEGLMRITPDTITRWKYAIVTTIASGMVLSVAIGFLQKEVLWQDSLARGGVAVVLSIVFYDVLKSIILTLPFKKPEA